MVVDAAAAALLALGAVACAGAAASPAVRAGPRAGPAARAAFAVALLCAAVAAAADDPPPALQLVAAAVALGGLALLVLARHEWVPAMSWLDAVMGGCAVAAVAVDASVSPPAALAIAGVVAVVSLSRWRLGLAAGLGLPG